MYFNLLVKRKIPGSINVVLDEMKDEDYDSYNEIYLCWFNQDKFSKGDTIFVAWNVDVIDVKHG